MLTSRLGFVSLGMLREVVLRLEELERGALPAIRAIHSIVNSFTVTFHAVLRVERLRALRRVEASKRGHGWVGMEKRSFDDWEIGNERGL